MNNKFPRIIGSLAIESKLSLEEVAEILSERVFGGAKFGGKELKIYDEVPTVFIANGILGLRVILQGFSSNQHFHLGLIPDFKLKNIEKYEIDLSFYLIGLFKDKLEDIPEIKIAEESGNEI